MAFAAQGLKTPIRMPKGKLIISGGFMVAYQSLPKGPPVCLAFPGQASLTKRLFSKLCGPEISPSPA